MQLEVGKTYYTGTGKHVTITQELSPDNEWYPFGYRFCAGRPELVYTDKGHVSPSNETIDDLMGEVQ